MASVTFTAPCPRGHKGATWTQTESFQQPSAHDFVCVRCDPSPLVRVPAQRVGEVMSNAGVVVRFLGVMLRD